MFPKLGSGGHDVSRKRAVEVGDGGDGGSCSPNMGTCECDGSQKHVMEVGAGGSYVLKPVLGSYGSDRIWKRVVVMEGGSDDTYALNLGSCGRDGSPRARSTSSRWAAAMGSNRSEKGATCVGTATDMVGLCGLQGAVVRSRLKG
jgi:hypothetical protein